MTPHLVRWVLLGTGAAAIVIATALGISQWLSQNALQNAPVSQRAFDPPGPISPRPILTDRPAHLRQREQRAHLQKFGWVDRPQGRVHIPIDVAMDLIVAQEGAAP
jgi:hypothetical protein